MLGKRSFYKNIGHELMKELGEAYADSELNPGGEPGAYATLRLPNEMHVSFTSWRGGDAPFYIMLFKGKKYVFELDLSMIVYDQGKFTWHLRTRAHERNVKLLDTWLGESVPFSGKYCDSVSSIKKELKSGKNTPRVGYLFIQDVEWSDVCDRFIELMRRAIETHIDNGQIAPVLVEVMDDDGSVVDVKRKYRRNQSLFRLNMMQLYESTCAISGESVVEVLEAAHIVGHAEAGVNHTGNGLLLRSDLHRLFDSSLIAIDPISLKVAVSPDLVETKYQKFSGKKLRSRIDGSNPEKKYLDIKWEQAGFEG